MIVVLYGRGFIETVSRIRKKRWPMKPLQTLRNIFVHPKDKLYPREGYIQ